ncbi:archaetidylserine decarboxylase [Parahalioglobus pacificus]|uniref:Phosphatidylserine decarboxylase proenzyme n=1 Tax=Parahalioglobus pacificus TaxID=930806 RepID=A0A918XN30_9GAMM|nr:archaetidylserine decarboxylase [Halioglobus pacificus]GHD38905.1 hypothetical protein GCM10007053_29920 [Halioglobus pacificus]
MESLFILFQHVVPQQLLSRFTGWLAELRYPLWLKNWVIEQFVRHFDVQLHQAVHERAQDYVNFNDFFTRELKPGMRPIAEADVVHPADGAVSQIGTITDGSVLQAKGRTYTVSDLLAGDETRTAQFTDGNFATIYLSPRDYHRVHMPVSGTLTASCYVPGKLFSVNGTTAENVDRLFARNERLVCYFDTALGPMAMVLVGAMVVAGIETVWDGQVAPPLKVPQTKDYSALPEPVTLAQGEEMGRFKLGSTVILLFPEGAVDWLADYQPGTATVLGQPLAQRQG